MIGDAMTMSNTSTNTSTNTDASADVIITRVQTIADEAPIPRASHAH
jgi:hypothetical protein